MYEQPQGEQWKKLQEGRQFIYWKKSIYNINITAVLNCLRISMCYFDMGNTSGIIPKALLALALISHARIFQQVTSYFLLRPQWASSPSSQSTKRVFLERADLGEIWDENILQKKPQKGIKKWQKLPNVGLAHPAFYYVYLFPTNFGYLFSVIWKACQPWAIFSCNWKAHSMTRWSGCLTHHNSPWEVA